MKGIVLSIAAAMLTASSSVVPFQPATAQGASEEVKELQAFCQALIASGDFPDLVFGECMSFNVMSEDGFKVALCGYFRDNELLGQAGFDSFSDCVRNVEY